MNPVPVIADLNGVCHCGLEPQSMNPNSWMPPDQVRGRLLEPGMTANHEVMAI
jgi:hypothetical protein